MQHGASAITPTLAGATTMKTTVIAACTATKAPTRLNMRTATGPAASLRADATKLFQVASPEGRAVAGSRRPSWTGRFNSGHFCETF